MATKLEKRADELWKGYGENNPKFWRKYEQLIQSSREASFKFLVPQKGAVLDPLAAYEQLLQSQYPDLYQKDKIFSSRFLLQSVLYGFSFGLSAFSFAGYWGIPLASGVLIGVQSLGVLLFKTGRSITLEIHPYHLELGNKVQKKRILFEHIAAFSLSKEDIRLKIVIPKKKGRFRRRAYTIPLTTKQGRLPDAEIKVICQLLEAIIHQNNQIKQISPKT